MLTLTAATQRRLSQPARNRNSDKQTQSSEENITYRQQHSGISPYRSHLSTLKLSKLKIHSPVMSLSHRETPEFHINMTLITGRQTYTQTVDTQ